MDRSSNCTFTGLQRIPVLQLPPHLQNLTGPDLVAPGGVLGEVHHAAAFVARVRDNSGAIFDEVHADFALGSALGPSTLKKPKKNALLDRSNGQQLPAPQPRVSARLASCLLCLTLAECPPLD
jgi:hypothetical protein